MTAHSGPGAASDTACWCCGTPYSDADLVHLGQHPEVGICAGCARWLHRRAMAHHDDQHPSAAGQLRRAIGTLRERVIKQGWHNRPIIGKLLRRLDRHLP